VKSLFRPSYGGNRNYTLIYTLGGLVVSADDDMRPYALMEHSPESLESEEICRGRLHPIGRKRLMGASRSTSSPPSGMLGKTAAQAPDNYERGELVIDNAMELETNRHDWTEA